MYSTHQSIISRWARQNPENLAKVLQFVILTVQTPLYRVPADTETAEQGGDDAMGVLFGFKWKAYVDSWSDREYIYGYLEHIFETDDDDQTKSIAMIEFLADRWGFGPVKAGFVTQLIYGLAGCIDTHNLRRFGLGKKAFDAFSYSRLRTAKGRRRFLTKYVTFCYDTCGGPEKLWDDWCSYVAKRSPTIYQDGEHVSRLHCEALNLPTEKAD